MRATLIILSVVLVTLIVGCEPAAADNEAKKNEAQSDPQSEQPDESKTDQATKNQPQEDVPQKTDAPERYVSKLHRFSCDFPAEVHETRTPMPDGRGTISYGFASGGDGFAAAVATQQIDPRTVQNLNAWLYQCLDGLVDELKTPTRSRERVTFCGQPAVRFVTHEKTPDGMLITHGYVMLRNKERSYIVTGMQLEETERITKFLKSFRLED